MREADVCLASRLRDRTEGDGIHAREITYRELGLYIDASSLNKCINEELAERRTERWKGIGMFNARLFTCFQGRPRQCNLSAFGCK